MWWNAMCCERWFAMHMIYAISICYKISMLFLSSSSLDICLRFCRDVRGTLRKPSKLDWAADYMKNTLFTKWMSVWGWEVDGDTVSNYSTHAHTQNQAKKTRRITDNKCSILFSNNTAWMRPSPSMSKSYYNAKERDWSKRFVFSLEKRILHL